MTNPKVDVYRNLRHGGFSVKSRESEDYGIVRGRHPHALVADATFVVQEGGRAATVEKEERSVHAFVRGKLISTSDGLEDPDLSQWLEVTYNPFKYETFVVRDTLEPVEEADRVLLTRDRCYVPYLLD